MLALQRPSKQAHTAFSDYFYREKPYKRLTGVSRDVYRDRHDLVSLVSNKDDDRLTTFLREHLPFLFQRRQDPVAKHSHPSVRSLSEYRLGVAVSLINIVVAAVMLFGAIYNLFYVHDLKKRLGIVAGYTIAFAACVALLSNARRSEIFSACAAYAAVLVVFVSGNLSS